MHRISSAQHSLGHPRDYTSSATKMRDLNKMSPTAVCFPGNKNEWFTQINAARAAG